MGQPQVAWLQTNEAAIDGATPYPQFGAETAVPQTAPLDPDRPRWGPLTGIGVWLFSVAAIIVVPVGAVILWYILDKQRGIDVPDPTDKDALVAWVMSPKLLLVQVYSTMAAHLITLAFCWAVVTRLRAQPFLKSLGWNWGGRSALYWVLASIGIIIAIIAADQFFIKVLPQSETSFDKLLQSSQQVRIAVAVLATLSAPFIEEIIYRGILYAGLRKRMGLVSTTITVTILFAGVHVLQYWGAWASIAGLTLLSLILTVVRARTRSILPCVVIHFVNNFFFSILIVLNKA
jgi:membrane protease YdiL (CAAX protease family)